MKAPGGTLWGYPKGVFLLSFTELWERFSYFGMLALLVLFLTAGVEAGGFGWERESAIKLYGFYTGVAFSIPLLGGWIANRSLGERRCIVAGGLLLICGHACLSGPAVVPWLAQRLTGIDLHALWVASGVQLGELFPSAALQARLDAAATAAGASVFWVAIAYRAVAWSFLGGLALIIAGTGFIKPTISSIIGRFYEAGDRRRDAAFAVFFVGIYAGALVANIVVGFLGERVAWHWGFSAAAFGMTLGMVVYLWKQQAYLGDLGRAAVGNAAPGERPPPLTAEQWDRIKVLAFQGIFTVAYAAAFYQKGGLLTLFARENLDRSAGSWEVPVTWLLTISTATFIITTPLFARLWQRLEPLGRNPGAPTKLAWGLMMLATGYLAIAWAAPSLGEVQDVKPSWGWLVITYVCFGIGDALVWPNQISMVSRLAPLHLSALMVGGWYITIGLGSWITGYVGALGYEHGMQELFIGLAITLVALGSVLWATVPRLRRLMHGID
jgi:POT family proton-dependent oligopeptide transporter